jgi:hypothetical protein
MLFYRPQSRGVVPCVEGTEGVEFEVFAKPIQGEPVVRKQTFDGFLDTDLAKILGERGSKPCSSGDWRPLYVSYSQQIQLISDVLFQ